MGRGISTDLSEHNIRKIVVGRDLGYNITVGQKFRVNNGQELKITHIEFDGKYLSLHGIQKFDVYAEVDGVHFYWKSVANSDVMAEVDFNF
jgi:hypothetical protein